MNNPAAVTPFAHSDRDSELRSYEMDRKILALLERKPDRGTSPREAGHAKEMQLGALFARLTIDEVKVMYRRFTMPASDDHVAAHLSSLRPTRTRLTYSGN